MDIKKAVQECKKGNMTADAYAEKNILNPIQCRNLKTALGEKAKKKRKIKRY